MKKILIFITVIFLSIGAFGQTSVNKRIMLDSLNNKLNRGIIDHFALKDGNLVAIKANGDTLDYHITISGGQELGDVAFLHTDTVHTNGKHYLYTQWQVDSLATKKVNIKDSTGISSGNYMPRKSVIDLNKITQLKFKIDSAQGGPLTGDSIFINTNLINKSIEVFRDTSGIGLLGKLYEEPYATDDPNYCYEFNNITGTLTFHPSFTTGERIIINARDSILTESVTSFYCDEYQTVYNAMTTKPSLSIANYQNRLVYRLDTMTYWSGGTSVWDRLDVFMVPATEYNTANEALINWASPGTYNGENISATAWAQYEGYTGDGSADYIGVTNYNPSSLTGINYTLNSATIGIYLRTDLQLNNRFVFGAYTPSYQTYFNPRNNDDSGYTEGRLNTSSAMFYPASSDSRGLWILTRRASNAIELYHNGSSVVSDSDASTGIPNNSIWILGVSGTSSFSSHQFSIFFIMDKIYHDDEATAINTVIEQYMDAIGKGVE